MKTEKHTLLPWIDATEMVDDDYGRVWVRTTNPDGHSHVASTNNPADAAFIVRAVNAHEDLLTVARCIVAYVNDETQEKFDCIVDAAREALVKAEGK